jgi:Lon protease-like protein
MSAPPLDLADILDDFRGIARLFPLPSLVLFPDSLAPLNVFEPRYLEMVRDALPDDGLIATALLKPGYEAEYLGTPAVHPVVSIGKILRPRSKPNGHIEMLLYGIARARVLEEIPSQPFRRARVEILPDVLEPGEAEAVAVRMRRALDLVPGRQATIWGLRHMAEQLRGVDGTPGRYADAVAHASDLPKEALYEVLAEPNVLRRFDRLIAHLESRAVEGAPRAPLPSDPRFN